MPRELITIQIGQCGNQIGCRFWDLALREHAKHKMNSKSSSSSSSSSSKNEPIYDEALSTFFRNVDTKYSDLPNIPFDPKKPTSIKGLKARAILIDMENGVLDGLLKGQLGDLFDSRQTVHDVSGSGNNWAHGHEIYGKQYHDEILERVREAVELCDSLQCFFFIHSLGGGTGSGLGTYVLKILEDEYPDIYRFVAGVFPSEDDDVVTSPYNAMLSMNELINSADCVLPIDNQSLFDMTGKVNKISNKQNRLNNSTIYDKNSNITSNNSNFNNNNNNNNNIYNSLGSKNKKLLKDKKKKPYDEMNNIAAHLLTGLTSSMRFEGNLNVDLNEITMNLVPFPKLHFLVSSLSPLVLPKDVHLPPRRLDQMFIDGFSKDFQLMKADPRHYRYLACGLIVRGNVQVSDINRNINKIKKEIDMIHWNKDGFKVGLCNVPPIGQPYSLLTLANNCCLTYTCNEMRKRFLKFYNKNFFLHHYTKIIEKSHFQDAIENLSSLIDDYDALSVSKPKGNIPRFIPDF